MSILATNTECRLSVSEIWHKQLSSVGIALLQAGSRIISTLGCLKTSFRSTMGQEHLALMHINGCG